MASRLQLYRLWYSLPRLKLLGSTTATATDNASQLPIRIDQLCDICAAASESILATYTEWGKRTINSHHQLLSGIRLRKRAKDKCHMCFIFQRGLNNAIYFPILYELLLDSIDQFELFQLRIRQRFSSKESVLGYLRVLRTPEALPLTISSTGLESTYRQYLSPLGRKKWATELISRWMGECSANHSKCQLPNNISLPTRLIHILGREHVHLVISAELTAVGRISAAKYATVSHCWGSAQFLKLKSNNLEMFKRSIPFNSLTRKFQQIISLCHALSIEYVWIDTMCIIQGDLVDWAKEASRMAAVYQFGIINFTVIGSSENDTCFPEMNMMELLPCRMKTKELDGNSQESFWLQPEVDLANYFDPRHKDFFPILKRGWVFQERYLSRSTVYLGGQRLIWDCRVCLLSEETGLVNHIKAFNSFSIPHDSKTQEGMIRMAYGDDPLERRRCLMEWMLIVRGYTSADLTYATDRLAGIAGIAAAFQQSPSECYIAGMWEGQLDCGSLFWRPLDTADALIHGSFLEGSPSWSWASVSLPVKLHINPDDEHCKLTVSKVVKSSTQHVFGEVTEAVLTIEAHVISPNCPKWLCEIVVTFSSLICCLGLGDTVCCPSSCSTNFMRLGKTSDDRHTRYAIKNYALLSFLECAFCDHNGTSTGLILVRAPKRENAFIRVGSFEGDYYSNKYHSSRGKHSRAQLDIRSYRII